MRKFLLLPFLLLSILVHTVCFADTVGYSGDTRRYVTDEEKKQFPYNTVVRLEYWNDSDDNGTGTGTFIDNDTILTCLHVVKDVKPNTSGNRYINYYTTDGQKNTGIIDLIFKDEGELQETDVALIYTNDKKFNRMLDWTRDTSAIGQEVMVIGYDSLKVLSKNELKIVKELYTNWIRKNGKITGQNSTKATNGIEQELKSKYACSSNNKKNCVRCSDSRNSCIFEDYKNMKVRTGCKITEIYNSIIFTNCPGAPGASGSAIINSNTNTIVGLFCAVDQNQIGQHKDASTFGPPIKVLNRLNSD